MSGYGGFDRLYISCADGNNRCDIIVDDGRRGFRFQYTCYSSLHNSGEIFDVD